MPQSRREQRCSRLDDPLICGYEERVARSASHHESLSTLAPPKLKKFEKSQALPFPGYSLVQWIYSQDELWHRLNSLSKVLEEDFVRERIKQCFYFLPATTFHATVRDLVLGTPRNLDNYVQAVRSAYNRLAEWRMKAPEMEAEGLSFVGESSIAVILHPLDPQSLSTVVELRRAVARELKSNHEVLTELDPADFFGHVTLVYPVAELPAEIYARAKELVRAQSQRAGVIGNLTFDAVQLRRFDSMIDWSEPLETLRFGGIDT